MMLDSIKRFRITYFESYFENNNKDIEFDIEDRTFLYK